MLSDAEREIVQQTPLGSRTALEHEMQILKFREHKILAKIAEYEAAPEDSLYINSLMDMRVPGGHGKDKQDGALQSMGMYSKDSAFSRVLKLQEALYKVQGRIAKIADSLRAVSYTHLDVYKRQVHPPDCPGGPACSGRPEEAGGLAAAASEPLAHGAGGI